MCVYSENTQLFQTPNALDMKLKSSENVYCQVLFQNKENFDVNFLLKDILKNCPFFIFKIPSISNFKARKS